MPQLKSLRAAAEDLVQILKKTKEEHFSETSFFFLLFQLSAFPLNFPSLLWKRMNIFSILSSTNPPYRLRFPQWWLKQFSCFQVLHFIPSAAALLAKPRAFDRSQSQHDPSEEGFNPAHLLAFIIATAPMLKIFMTASPYLGITYNLPYIYHIRPTCVCHLDGSISLKQLFVAVFRSSALVRTPTLYFQSNWCHFISCLLYNFY